MAYCVKCKKDTTFNEHTHLSTNGLLIGECKECRTPRVIPQNQPPSQLAKEIDTDNQKKTSDLEEAMITQFKYQGFVPEREYRFDEERRWRFDFAFPELKVAVEIEGGIWTQGRHARPKGILGDMEKSNKAQMLGWIVLRYDGEKIKSGEAVREVLNFIKSLGDDRKNGGIKEVEAGKQSGDDGGSL